MVFEAADAGDRVRVRLDAVMIEDLDPSLALELLVRSGATVGRATDGRLLVVDAPGWWRPTADLEQLVRWAVAGGDHEWRRCSFCAAMTLRSRRSAAKKCHLTPGCPGRIEKRPKPEAGDGSCERPGCEGTGIRVTHGHGLLCRLCFAEAAVRTSLIEESA